MGPRCSVSAAIRPGSRRHVAGRGHHAPSSTLSRDRVVSSLTSAVPGLTSWTASGRSWGGRGVGSAMAAARPRFARRCVPATTLVWPPTRNASLGFTVLRGRRTGRGAAPATGAWTGKALVTPELGDLGRRRMKLPPRAREGGSHGNTARAEDVPRPRHEGLGRGDRGQPPLGVTGAKLHDDLGIDAQDLAAACTYLAGEGLITVDWVAGNTPAMVTLTHQGIRLMEAEEERG